MGFICPLCSEYIEEMELSHTYCHYTFLKKKEIITEPDESTFVEDHIEVKEFRDPFNCWGILGIDRSFESHQENTSETIEVDDDMNNLRNDEIVAEYQAPY